MAENTSISWADDTVNFWWGCEKIAPGCKSCYAKTISDRFFGDLWGATKPRGYIASAAETCLKLNRKAEREGQPRIVFVNSMSDFFEEHDGPIIDRKGARIAVCGQQFIPVRDSLLAEAGRRRIAARRVAKSYPSANWVDAPGIQWASLDDLRREAFRVMDECPWLRFMLLTKRPENIPEMIVPVSRDIWSKRLHGIDMVDPNWEPTPEQKSGLYHPNILLGTSISDLPTAEQNIPALAECRKLCPILFLSIEPFLGPLPENFVARTLCPNCSDGMVRVDDEGGLDFFGPECTVCNGTGRMIDQIIIGVESSGPRVGRLGEFHTESAWLEGAQSVVDQCRAAGVAMHVKQIPRDGLVEHDVAKFPEGLRFQEFPEVAHA